MEVSEKYSSKEIQRMLCIGCEPILAKYGYHRVPGSYNFCKQFQDGVYGFWYLIRSSGGEKNRTNVYPNLGISHPAVFNLECKLMEGKIYRHVQPIVNFNLVDIIPGGNFFDWYRSIGTLAEIDKFMSLVEESVTKYADPYFAVHCNWDAMLQDVYEGRFLISSERDRIYPIMLYLSNHKKEALEYIENRIAKTTNVERKAYSGSPVYSVFLKNIRALLVDDGE